MASDDVEVGELKQQFSDFLKKKNYRNTQERYRVLDRITELDRHFNADDLYFYMSGKGDRISRATIYSTLDLLTKCAILVKHRFQGDSAHFELSSRMPDHDHLICVECGHIIEFHERELDALQEKVCSQFGFRPLKHSWQIFASCPDIAACEFNKQK